MSEPSVSVVIPTYNHAEFMRCCLDSVFAQDYESIEVLVVDDGSTDETHDIVARYGNAVRYHRQENQGQAVARAWGLRHISGDLVCLLDSDDYWEPGFLASLVPQFENPHLGLAFTNHDRVKADGEVFVSDVFRCQRDWLMPFVKTSEPGSWTTLDEKKTRLLYCSHYPPGPSGALFRRSLIQQMPDSNLRRGDDFLFFMKYILDSHCEVAFTMDVLWHLRTHDRNIRQLSNKLDLLFECDIEAKKELLKAYADELSQEERKALQHRIAVDLFDWGFAEAQRRNLGKAVSRYLAAGWCDGGGPITRKALSSLVKLPLKWMR